MRNMRAFCWFNCLLTLYWQMASYQDWGSVLRSLLIQFSPHDIGGSVCS